MNKASYFCYIIFPVCVYMGVIEIQSYVLNFGLIQGTNPDV